MPEKARKIEHMGRLNLLKGSFEGKVGEIYGAKQRRKCFAKAVPFSHTPHNSAQKNAFSAFQCLVRLSSGLSKYAWYMFGFYAKDMSKHNKICQFLRPLVSGGVFNLPKIADLLYKDGSFTLSGLIVAEPQTSLSVDFAVSAKTSPTASLESFFCVVNNAGSIIAHAKSVQESGKISLIWQDPLQDGSYLLAFNQEAYKGCMRLRDAVILPLK